jgi:glycosyltransferase involved in cell wall biosynthesis
MKVLFVRRERYHNYYTGLERYEDNIIKNVKVKSTEILKTKKKTFRELFLSFLGFDFSKKTNINNNDYNLIHFLTPIILNKSFGSAKIVTTIHDLCPLIISSAYSFHMPFYYKYVIKKLIKKKSYFITNSESTKNDLVHFFNINKERVFVTPLGISDKFERPNDNKIRLILSKYKIFDDYFLFTGAMNKRKNLKTTIEAFIKFKEETKSKTKLVLAGRMNWGGSEIEKLVKNNNLQYEVLLPGYIDDQDLPAIISGANAVLYLSLYEGFGFPALEAMKVGTPVIASNNSSIPEVVEDAGLLVNPLDLNEIVNAMCEFSFNTKLRNQCIQKGIKQAEKFSWEKTAKKTLEVYKNIIALNSNEKS